jgi:hypothetical protein
MTGIRPNSGRPILIPVNPLPNAALGRAASSSRATAGQVPHPAYATVARSGRGTWSSASTVLPELRQRAWGLANQDRISKHYFARVRGSEIPQIRAGIPGASNWSGASRATRLPRGCAAMAGPGMGRRCELGSLRTVSPHTRPVGSRSPPPGAGVMRACPGGSSTAAGRHQREGNYPDVFTGAARRSSPVDSSAPSSAATSRAPSSRRSSAAARPVTLAQDGRRSVDVGQTKR